MKYNGPSQNMGYGPNQYQQPWGYQNQGMPQNNPYQNTGWGNQPNTNYGGGGWGNYPNQPLNQGWGNTPSTQGNMPQNTGCGTTNKNLGYGQNYPNYTK